MLALPEISALHQLREPPLLVALSRTGNAIPKEFMPTPERWDYIMDKLVVPVEE